MGFLLTPCGVSLLRDSRIVYIILVKQSDNGFISWYHSCCLVILDNPGLYQWLFRYIGIVTFVAASHCNSI